jgi:hypothetical protein
MKSKVYCTSKDYSFIFIEIIGLRILYQNLVRYRKTHANGDRVLYLYVLVLLKNFKIYLSNIKFHQGCTISF